MRVPRIVFGQPVRFPFDVASLALAKDEAPPQWVVEETLRPGEASPDWTHSADGDEAAGTLGGWRDRSDTLVAYPNGVRFLISPDKRTISYEAPAATPVDQLTHVLINSIIPVALASTGGLVLHASVVGDGRTCIAFAGASGAGKSTMVAYLSHVRGCELLADDGALVEWHDDVPCLIPSSSGLRLWPDSFREIFPMIDPTHVMDSSEKCVVPGIEPAAPPPAQLARIFIMAASAEGAAPSIEVPSLKDAMLTLATSVFRANLHSRELLAKEFRSLERLVSTGIVRTLRYSRRFDELPVVADMIARDVAGGS